MRLRAIESCFPFSAGTWQLTTGGGSGGGRSGSGAGGGDACTTSVAVAVCMRRPLVPATVTGNEPVAVAPLVVTESVDEEVAGFGLKDAVAPTGSPLSLKLTELAKPPLGVIVTV